jgi:ribose 5-phosphate isomerase A
VQPDFEVYPDSGAVHHAAANLFADLSQRAVGERGRFCVALSGGATPHGLYALLARAPYRDKVAWHKTHVFWGDERHVAPDDPGSNFGMAEKVLLSRVPVPNSQVHRVPTELAPADAAADYAATVRQVLGQRGFDLILVGMGTDGHTASLFPGADSLRADGRGAVACHVDALQAWRVTLTLPEINCAEAIVFLLTGRDKAAAFADVRSGQSALPAARVGPENGTLRWMLDRATADAAQAHQAGGVSPTRERRSPDLEQAKAHAGRRAARMVDSGTRVGLGTGSTARHVVLGIGERLASGELVDVIGVPTSESTEALAREVGIPLTTLGRQPRLDVTIDGADEVSPTLDLVKGLGGALLREKIVAAASDRMIVVADATKLVDRLGTKAPLPVAVAPFAWEVHVEALREMGAEPVLRIEDDGTPTITDDGLFILDCHFAAGIADPRIVERAVRARPGVVETGLFLGMADTAIIADDVGIMIYRR